MKLTAFILFLVVLFSTVIPCSTFDGCEDTCTQQGPCSDEEGEEDGCRNCSPFSVCSTGNDLAVANIHTAVQPPPAVEGRAIYADIHSFFHSEYHASLFQPPRYL